MTKGYIYKYTFPDGKVYIGQTRRPVNERHREHFDKRIGRLNTKFWNAYQTVGIPQYEIIETIECERVQDLVAKLNDTETFYIRKYKSTNPLFGYNVRERACVPIPRDVALEAEFDKLWIECAEKWYPIFESVKEKCFDTFEPLDEEELVFCNEILKDNIFEDAVSELNFDLHNLKSNSINARLFFDDALSFAEMVFQDESWANIRKYIEENKKRILMENPPETTIVKIDRNGKIVAEYVYPVDIKEEMGLSSLTNIYNVLEGKQRHAYGFTWRYKKDLEKSSAIENNGQMRFDF